MADKLAWIEDELRALHEQGLYNTIRTIGSAQAPGWSWTGGGC